jgi:hypothetical protein
MRNAIRSSGFIQGEKWVLARRAQAVSCFCCNWLFILWNLLTRWRRDLLDTLTVGELVNKLSDFCGTRMFVAVFTGARYWTPTWAGWINATAVQHFTNVYLNKLSIIRIVWIRGIVMWSRLWRRYAKPRTPTPRFLKLRLRLLHKSSMCINNGKPIRHFITTTWIIRLVFRLITYI